VAQEGRWSGEQRSLENLDLVKEKGQEGEHIKQVTEGYTLKCLLLPNLVPTISVLVKTQVR